MKEILSLSELKKRIDSYSSIYILGKGPSMNRDSYSSIPADSFRITINENAIIYDCEASFFIDIEPLKRSIEHILKYPRILILPRYLNERISSKESRGMKIRTLDVLSKSYPKVLSLNTIYFFNEGSDNNKPIFKPRLVSVTALLEIMFYLGFNKVFGIGFDGGRSYSSELISQFTSTMVKTFSNQFFEFKSLEIIYKSNFNVMNKENINIYVGTTKEQALAFKVLKNSILANTEHNVNVYRLDHAISERGIKIDHYEGGTPFSLQRFFIPKLNNHEGIAIYLDSDMLVFEDIIGLYQSHKEGVTLCSCPAPPNSNRRDQYSVFTVDCNRAKWETEEILKLAKENYKSVMFDFSFEDNKEKCIDWRWNSLEYYDRETKLIHFTDMDKQPWIDHRNINAKVWIKELKANIERGWIKREEIELQIRDNIIRPGVLKDLESQSIFSKIDDFFYLPPHTIRRFPKFKFVGGKYILALIIRFKRFMASSYDK